MKYAIMSPTALAFQYFTLPLCLGIHRRHRDIVALFFISPPGRIDCRINLKEGHGYGQGYGLAHPNR